MDRLTGRLKSLMYYGVLLLISIAVLSGLTYYQDYFTLKATADTVVTEQEENVIQRISMLISAAIFLMIELTKYVSPKLVDMELHVSASNRIISHATKLSITSFFYTSIVSFSFTVFYTKNFFGRGGFIYNQTMVFLQNSLLNPIMNMINTDFLIWRYHQKPKLVKSIKSKECYDTQQSVNKQMEMPEYDIADKYSDIMNTMWTTFLYAPVIPIVLVLSLLNLGFTYWVEKYTLLRRSTIKNTISKQVSIEMIELLEFTIIFYALGKRSPKPARPQARNRPLTEKHCQPQLRVLSL